MAGQLISTAVHDRLPEKYVRPEAQRPRLDQVMADAGILVVDLANPDRAAVVAQIGEACSTHGFFQVLNHGLPAELMMVMQAVAYEFFRLPSLPAAEKAKLADPAKKMSLSTSFNVRKETVHNREIVSRYSRELQELGFRLYGAISESLGLDEEYIKTVHGEQEQQVAVNLYRLAPAVAYGLQARTDPNALTILLMNQQVAGLQQVLKEGSWIAGNPQPNALVINIGDQLQVRVDEAMRAKDGGPIAVWPKDDSCIVSHHWDRRWRHQSCGGLWILCDPACWSLPGHGKCSWCLGSDAWTVRLCLKTKVRGSTLHQGTVWSIPL